MSGKTVNLVVDPHAGRVVGVESDTGESLGGATPLDLRANLQRVRRKPEQPGDDDGIGVCAGAPKGANLVELAHQQYYQLEA